MDVRLYFCAVPRVPTMASLSRAVALPKAAGSAEAPRNTRGGVSSAVGFVERMLSGRSWAVDVRCAGR
jgi:hypothetical protein